MNTTVRMKASQITKDWHVLDAAGEPLGRLATRAATLLRGKHKATFEPHLDGGDFVIIVNASKIAVSGAKAEAKLYYRHSGYPGGLKSRTLEEELARFPDRVVREAVWGMLPKGPLGRSLLRHLKVYPGPDHPHQSQVVGSERAREDRDDSIPWTPPRLGRLRGAGLTEEDLQESLAEPPQEDTVAPAVPEEEAPAPTVAEEAAPKAPEAAVSSTEEEAEKPKRKPRARRRRDSTPDPGDDEKTSDDSEGAEE